MHSKTTIEGVGGGGGGVYSILRYPENVKIPIAMTQKLFVTG